MREIKFRAWDNVQKTFIQDGVFIDMFGDVYGLRSLPNGNSSDTQDFLDNNIELTQYTGLNDKTGKDIYENDIILWENSDGEEVKDKVLFFNGAFRMRNMGFTLFDYSDSNIFEVIGNIYQNPELLEN